MKHPLVGGNNHRNIAEGILTRAVTLEKSHQEMLDLFESYSHLIPLEIWPLLTPLLANQMKQISKIQALADEALEIIRNDRTGPVTSDVTTELYSLKEYVTGLQCRIEMLEDKLGADQLSEDLRDIVEKH